MSIHWEAMRHLDKAKQLLATSDDDQLRYAALELRYAVEHLFYKLIPSFKEELPDDVLEGKVWRPGDIIDMLADIEPRISSDVVLSFGVEPSPGAQPKQMYVMGRQSGISKDLVRKAYHALGFYLHARVDQAPHDPVRLRKKLEKLIPYLEKFRGDTVISSGFAARSTFRCQECGRSISKRPHTLEKDPYVTCPNKNCRAVYEVGEEEEPGRHPWKMLQHNLVCPECGAANWFGVHKLEAGAAAHATFNCNGCHAKYRMEARLYIVPVTEAAPAAKTGA